MLFNGSRMDDFPILSLHLGGRIARVNSPIIDPKKLKIVGFFVDSPVSENGEAGNILLIDSIREFSPSGFIIDSTDDFVSEGDIVRIDEILNYNFILKGIKVVSKKNSKLGKVSDFTFDTNDFRILQLIVQRPVLKSFMDPELIIHRKEIEDISNTRIVIKDEAKKIQEKAMTEDFVPNFVNPFRDANFMNTEKDKE